MIQNKISFLIISTIHFTIAIGSSFLNFAWQMTILDDLNPQDIIPWGLYVINSISGIFTAPIFLLFGHQILNLSSLWLIALIILLNSIVVCYLLVFIWEKFLKSKSLASTIVVTILAITLVIVAGAGYFFLTQKPSIFTPAPTTQKPASNLNSGVITVIAPNDGEVFKIGSTVRVSWQAKNLPPNTTVDLQLATISSDRPAFDEKTGDCMNCVGGTSSIVLAVPSLVNGAGSIDWEVGKKLYPLFMPPVPGNNYIILATVSRPPTDAEVAECRKKYPRGPQCTDLEFVVGRDSSDATFSLTN